MPEPVTSRLSLRVQPNAARSELAGWHGTALRVRVTASPVPGRANAAVAAILADSLQIPRRSVNIVRGHGSRDKVAAVAGLDDAELQRRLRNLVNDAGSAAARN